MLGHRDQRTGLHMNPRVVASLRRSKPSRVGHRTRVYERGCLVGQTHRSQRGRRMIEARAVH